jgi:hypothetical protein
MKKIVLIIPTIHVADHVTKEYEKTSVTIGAENIVQSFIVAALITGMLINAKSVWRNRKMNLYIVCPDGQEWGCFVFAETPNKAKQMLVNKIDDTPYIDFRYSTLKKDVGGNPEVCDTDCERLDALGYKYMSIDEADEYESQLDWDYMAHCDIR